MHRDNRDKYLCPCGWVIEKTDWGIKDNLGWKCHRCGKKFGRLTEKPMGDFKKLDEKWYRRRQKKMNLKEGDILFDKRKKTYFRIINLFHNSIGSKSDYCHFGSVHCRTFADAKIRHMTDNHLIDSVLLDCIKVNSQRGNRLKKDKKR